MKRELALMLIAVTPLMFSVCGKAPGNTSQNGLTGAPVIATAPSTPSAAENNYTAEPKPSGNNGEENGMTNISVTVGGSTFSAYLYDNDAAKALLNQFPVTFDMSDLNGNEKYYYLADDLPSELSERPATINAGDIMCWSGDCLVLFYKTFSNSYGGYVRLGYIEDVTGFAAALGNGSVRVTFEVGD